MFISKFVLKDCIYIYIIFLSFQGLAYDHVDLNFFLNGKPTNTPVSGLKGTLYPVMYGK